MRTLEISYVLLVLLRLLIGYMGASFERGSFRHDKPLPSPKTNLMAPKDLTRRRHRQWIWSDE